MAGKKSGYSFDDSKPAKAEDLQKALLKIDSETLKTIAAVVDTHHQVKDKKRYVSEYRDPSYWRKAVNEIQQKEIFSIAPEDYYFSDEFFESKGRFFRAQGMTIHANHDQYESLKEVMDYLKNDPDSSKHIHEICEEHKLELLDKRAALNADLDEETGKDLILFHGHKYQLREHFREEYAVDTIEEFYIKALAVSILAETDGNSKIARDILEGGGMLIIKNLQPESVVSLLQELQIIALEGESEVLSGEKMNEEDMKKIDQDHDPRDLKNIEKDKGEMER